MVLPRELPLLGAVDQEEVEASQEVHFENVRRVEEQVTFPAQTTDPIVSQQAPQLDVASWKVMRTQGGLQVVAGGCQRGVAR